MSNQSTAPIVALEHVQVRLGGRIIQEDMSFTVKDGEFIAILGPNGAGKTTLLKLLLGLVKPNLGTVSVIGRTPSKGNKDIGYTPQFRVLDADFALRARDIVRFGLDGNRWGPGWPDRKRDAMVDQVLEEVNALCFADAPVGQLSGGEQRRLLIAQALLTNPRLLLLDEPLANLDITHGQEIVALVKTVCRSRNVAVMFATHDVNPLLPVVDRVLYMANGQCAVGTPDEVITSEALSNLYGSQVEVIRALGSMFVVGVQT